MANRYYRVNLGLNDTGSWSATPNGATGEAVPVDGDDVFFLELSGEITDDLSQFATGVPASITIGPECDLFIGDGNTMTIGDGTNTCATIKCQGRNRWSFTASAANAINDIYQMNRSGRVTVIKNSSSTAIDNVYAMAGRAVVRGDLKPNVYCLGSNADVDIAGSGTVAVLEALAGRVVCESSITTLNALPPAEVYVTEYANIGSANVLAGTLYLQSQGTTTTLVQKGGLLTPRGNKGTHTITNSTISGTNETTQFITKSGLSELVLTNAPVYLGSVSPKGTDDTDFGTGA